MRLNLRSFFAFILIAFSLITTIFFIDGGFLDSKFFGIVSSHQFKLYSNFWGDYAFLFFSFFIFVGVALLKSPSIINVCMVSTGYFLLITVIPLMFQLSRIPGVDRGVFEIMLTRTLWEFGTFFVYFIYFIWLLLALFTLFFPIRAELVFYFYSLIDIKEREIKYETNRESRGLSSKKTNVSSRKNKNGVTKNLPWFTKVFYPSDTKRIETTLIPEQAKVRTKKFILKETTPTSEYFVEVDTFSDIEFSSSDNPKINSNEEISLPKTTHSMSKEEYYEKIKQQWPQMWENKSNSNQAFQNIEITEEDAWVPESDSFEDELPENGSFEDGFYDDLPENDSFEDGFYDDLPENGSFEDEFYDDLPENDSFEDGFYDDLPENDSFEDEFYGDLPESETENESSQIFYFDEMSDGNSQQREEIFEDFEEIHTEENDGGLAKNKIFLNEESEYTDFTYPSNNINQEDIEKIVGKNSQLFLQENQKRIEEDSIEEIENFEEDQDYFPNAQILEDSFFQTDTEEHKRIQDEDARILEDTLGEFGIKAQVCEIIHGPVVTLFKIIPASGIKLSKIESLSDNLALRLAAQSIRIIAPIPGEKVVGIEVPNKNRELVSFKEMINSDNFINNKFYIPVGIGKDISGNIVVIDLHKMPHVLIAGATGAGKSVCVNVFLSSILFGRRPDEVKLVLIDPKIVELQPYDGIPHLLTPVITDSKDAINALKYLAYEMEQRYALLGEIGVRDIAEYRARVASGNLNFTNMPYIVAFVDEFADLMSTAGKEAEMLFARLTAKARAVGIHLVLATQRPSTDVITGLIKSNVPARFAFQVISYQDSRIILDQKGAEKLLGQGDMLYLSPTQPFPIRLQGAYLGKEEVDAIAEHWKNIAEPEYIDIKSILGIDEDEDDDLFSSIDRSKDALFEEAVEIVRSTRKASGSYLQRRLNIGYNRAAKMIEEMEKLGIVGPMQGSKPRTVLDD